MSYVFEDLYRSSNGDAWWLETAPDGLFVIHEANEASGGYKSRLPAKEFLRWGGPGPEVASLRRALLERKKTLSEESSMESVMRDCPL